VVLVDVGDGDVGAKLCVDNDALESFIRSLTQLLKMLLHMQRLIRCYLRHSNKYKCLARKWVSLTASNDDTLPF
jgi:hypothetical protein